MNAARSATQQEPEEEEVTMIPVEEGDEVTVEAVDSADEFTVEAGSTPVEEENKENPDSEVQALVEIRTKLRFIGNQVGLGTQRWCQPLWGTSTTKRTSIRSQSSPSACMSAPPRAKTSKLQGLAS